MTATIHSRITEVTYSVSLDKHAYSVTRRVNDAYANGKPYWVVRGGGVYRNHHCDESGTTYKKVVAATIAALEGESFPS